MSVGNYRFRLSAFRTPHSAIRIQGLLDSGADGQGVGADFHTLLGLLAGLGRVLTLNEGLLDGAGWLARRDGLAAFEWPRARTTSGQQRQRESGAQEPRQVTHRGRTRLGRRKAELRTLNIEP